MKHLINFKTFEGNVHDIGLEDDIENNCFVEMMDRGFKFRIIPFYMKSNGRHFTSVDNGIEITIDNNNVYEIDDILDELLTAKEYIEEKYNLELDFICKMNRNNIEYYKSFDELNNCFLKKIKIAFKPVGFLTKAKDYIKTIFKK